MKTLKNIAAYAYVELILTIYDIKPYCTLDNFFKTFGLTIVGYIWFLTIRVILFNVSHVPVLLPFANIVMGVVAIFVLPIMAYVLIIKVKE